MAVGVYASVLSLLRDLENVLLPSRCWLLPDKSQIEDFQRNLNFLQEFIEIHSSKTASNELLNQLAIQLTIPEVLKDADDLIDRYIVNRLRTAGSGQDQSSSKSLSDSLHRDIGGLIQATKSINQGLTEIMGEGHRRIIKTSRIPPNYSYSTIMVGFEDHLIHIRERLTGTEKDLQIIPIVGMGGIGKTTLARNIFYHKLIVEHFQERIWLTITQEYDVHHVLSGLVGDKDSDEDLVVLGTRLYQKLFGRRYLVVMDDVWDVKAWDDFEAYFPNNQKESRIMITSRLSNVAQSLGLDNIYRMSFLDDEKSWNLFSEIVFRYGGSWSSGLEEIGRKIVRTCGGLPLALVVMGGLLANSNGTREHWEFVAEDMYSFDSSEVDENCLRILSLSYDHLPIHLKPCFLYLGKYSKGSEIEVSELIRSWVAEGLVKPAISKCLEEVAREYVDELMCRNVILIQKLGSCGNVKTFGMHDLMWQVCVVESAKEKLFSTPRMQTIQVCNAEFNNSCFLCGERHANRKIHLLEVCSHTPSTATMIPLVCDGCLARYPSLRRYMFVRLINKVDDQDVSVLQTTKLRWLSIDIDVDREVEYSSPSTISLLWNLVGFDITVYGGAEVPLSGIWELPQLRYLRLLGCDLPGLMETDDFVVLQHLRSLIDVSSLRITEEFVRRVPNLVKLSVSYCFLGEQNCWYHCLYNLAYLDKLTSLDLSFHSFSLDRQSIAFPSSLKKLSLVGGELQWEDMTVIGSLPNLQKLTLARDSFVGDEWCPVEGQFQRLKYLKLENLGLVKWSAESYHFPDLAELVLSSLKHLEEFPLGIGDIDTIYKVRVFCCRECVGKTVMEIKEEVSCGDKDLQVDIIESGFSTSRLLEVGV